MHVACACVYARALGGGLSGDRLFSKGLSRVLLFVYIDGSCSPPFCVRSIFVYYLAPASYNIFLFHQLTIEYYSLLRDNLYWRMPKTFFWFSPVALDVPYYEFFLLLCLTALFAILLDTRVNSLLVQNMLPVTGKLFGMQKQSKVRAFFLHAFIFV